MRLDIFLTRRWVAPTMNLLAVEAAVRPRDLVDGPVRLPKPDLPLADANDTAGRGFFGALSDLDIMGAPVDAVDNQEAPIVVIAGGASIDTFPTTGAKSCSRSMTYSSGRRSSFAAVITRCMVRMMSPRRPRSVSVSSIVGSKRQASGPSRSARPIRSSSRARPMSSC
jgi:hypothetical protein